MEKKDKIKRFHILFKNPGEMDATGRNYETTSIIKAILDFEKENPDAKLLYIASEDIFKDFTRQLPVVDEFSEIINQKRHENKIREGESSSGENAS
jgi:hypothetical protein